MNGRIRFYGIRRKRLLTILGGWALTAVAFSLDVGVDGRPARTLLILVFYTVGMLTKARRDGSRALMRRQIAAETIEAHPDEQGEALYEDFILARRRELRLDAGVFLLMAALTGGLLALLVFAGAKPIAVFMGKYIFIPLLMLTSAGLFLASLLVLRSPDGEDVLAMVSPEDLAILRGGFPDHRFDAVPINRMKKLAYVPSREEMAQSALSMIAGKVWVAVVAEIMFLVLPVLMFLVSVFLSIVMPRERWMLVFCLFLLALCLPLDVYMIRLIGSGRRQTQWKKNLRSGRFTVLDDFVERVYTDPADAESAVVCFHRAGRYRVAVPTGTSGAGALAYVQSEIFGEVRLLTPGDGCAPVVFVLDLD